MTTIHWDKIEQSLSRAGHRMIWKPYGLPEVVDPVNSSFHDGDISSPWSIPSKMIVAVGISGALFSERINPRQPLTSEAILSEARTCVEAGASTVHIHVRDDRGYNTLSVERFREVIDPLRAEYPDLAIDGCLVPALDGEWAEMIKALDAGIFDAVPVNVTATYLGDSLFATPAAMMMEKTRLIQESGAKPIIACYSDADVSNASRYLFKSDLIETPSYWGILPALPGGSPMDNPWQMIEGLVRMSRAILELDPEAVIYVCAAGRPSTYLTTVAATLGLHVRVGMEDTVWLWPHREDRLESNLQHLELAVQTASLLGRDVASRSEYREIVGLPSSG